MKESAARTDAAATAAETVDSGATTAGTEAPADPVPDMVLARPPPGALHGNPEVKVAAAAATVAAMEAATEAATAETTAAATAAMKPQANMAEATAGEVAAAGCSAATPAAVATASTSLSPLTALHTLSSSVV
jgi:hypothetical protein